MKTFLILESQNFHITPAGLLRLSELARGYRVHYTRREAVTPELVSGADIIAGLVPPELLCHAVNLRWFHTINAGIEPYGDLKLFARKDFVFTNASGVFGIQIAEHGIGMLLALCRLLPSYIRGMECGAWTRYDDTREVYGSTAAVFGLGDLGLHTARLLRGFGCRILGVRQNVLEKPPDIDEVFTQRQMESVLCRADIVFNCLPLTSRTEKLFNKAAFSAMPRRSIFINLGRGGTVDQDALLSALHSGHLFGAGLDVTCPEPLPPEHELWRAENVIITPHAASASPETQKRGTDLLVYLLERFLAGKPMRNVVDFLREY